MNQETANNVYLQYKPSAIEERSIIARRVSHHMQTTREYSGIPKKTIASALGITSQKLTKYEKEEAEIEASVLMLFCEFFNITIASFLKDAFMYDAVGYHKYVERSIKYDRNN
ncbi:unnamed protein product [marine sediment metagenome]|uniref:HTH cro/C1-type domain-containing protein n=1 Tax=marine sediment metagenome TaxID=412755 RepID=X1FA36_9ZZZZ